MPGLIARLLVGMSDLFASHGRHRAGVYAFRTPPRRTVVSLAEAAPPFGLPRPGPAPTVRHWYEPIDGASTPLVRPYLTAYEREEKARLQRLRRDSLWLATCDVRLDTAVSTEVAYLLNCDTFRKCVAPAERTAFPQPPYTRSVDMTPDTRNIHARLGAVT